jgi:hypothetical protein
MALDATIDAAMTRDDDCDRGEESTSAALRPVEQCGASGATTAGCDVDLRNSRRV